MATQYNPGNYRPRAGRGRANDQPRYNRPPNQVHHSMPHRPHVPAGMNTTGASGARSVLLQQAPMFMPNVQTSTNSYPRFTQFPVYQQTPNMYQAGGMYMAPINIHLQPNPGAAGLPMAQPTASIGLGNAQPYQPPTQVPKAPPPKRERKAIPIVNPDTGKTVDVDGKKAPDPAPKEEPPSTEDTADVAKDFQQMVKSVVGEVSANEPRPNAIIRRPDEVKSEKVNGVEKSSAESEPLPPSVEEPADVVDGSAELEDHNTQPDHTQEPVKEPLKEEVAPQPEIPEQEERAEKDEVTEIPEKDDKPEIPKKDEIAELEPTTSEPLSEVTDEAPEGVPSAPSHVEETPGTIEEMLPPPPEQVEPEPPTREAFLLDDGPKKYSRSFLMGFAFVKGCQEPPAELTYNTEVFHRGAGKGFLQKDRQRPKGDGRKQEPKRIIHQPLTTEKVELHKADNRWERSAKTEAEVSDEEKQTAELYRKFQGILNKLTPQKFQKLAEQALTLEISTEERLTGCIDKIFTKALEEPNFSIAYANLCKVLSPIKVDYEDEHGQQKQTNFRRVLLTKCQTEFLRDKKNDEQLEEMTSKLESLESDEGRKKLQAEFEAFQTQARRRSLGNIRFIGELFKLSMLSETIMHECIVKLLKSTSDEESLECFARLITTTGQNLDMAKAKQRIDGYFGRINDIIKKGKIPSRIKFMLQDVQDLRSNDWVPRKAQASTLKTIDQIHAEAKQAEEEDKRLAAQHQALSSYKGGRVEDKKRPDFSTKADREKAPRDKPKMDRTRLERLKKGDNKSSSPLLGPQSLRPGGNAWSRGTQSPTPSQDPKDKKPNRSSSTGTKRGEKPTARGPPSLGAPRRGSQNSELASALEAVKMVAGGKPARAGSAPSTREAAAPVAVADKLDEDTVSRKTRTIVDELANNGDIEEAVACVAEMASPGMLNFLVSEAINHSLEKKLDVRSAAGQLMERLLRDGLISEAKILAGLNEILEFAEDIEMDVPMMWVYLSEILAPLFSQSTLPLSVLSKVPKQLVDSGKASVLAAEILNQCGRGQSEEVVSKLWTGSKLEWPLLGVKEENVAEFLTRKSLGFLLETPRPSTPLYFRDLSSLIGNTDTTNDEVIEWVEQKLSLEIKSPQFVNTLTKAMVEATVSDKGSSAIFNADLFFKRAVVLKKYVLDDESLQVEILYGLQVTITHLEHPPKLLHTIFDGLYDRELISEEAFWRWRDNGTEMYGKGNCVIAAKTFFTWLDSVSGDSDEPGET